MPMVSQEVWQPLTPEDPRYQFLLRLDPTCASLPGHWEVRGAEEINDEWLQAIPEQPVGRLSGRLQAPRPVVMRFGDVEIRYLPPMTAASGFRRWWTVAAGLLLKFKAVVFVGLVILNLLVYGLAFGWGFAVGLVAIIAIHEFGHVVANRHKGIRASMPYFIPFLGAFIRLRQAPKDAADEAYIGIMGPLFGITASLLALVLGLATHILLFLAAAEMGFVLHVFNLMPVLPLDGGRAVGFWKWRVWIPGMAGLLFVMFYNPLQKSFSIDPFTIVILGLVVYSLVREPRSRSNAYLAIAARARIEYTVLWAVALAVSIFGYWQVGHILPYIG